ncbi:MAG TPA: alanine--tRNA ligase [Chthoniobacteraceae bacterium]|nr:alanine--tRNA ligase [Chthoniobacteraceae bacterium]
MTSSQLRQSFLDFFREKEHTVVPSASLMPGSPNLLFTNAGMNQFVPIFLGESTADVDRWPGALPGSPKRAADTQKCIRAGGKHNDLDDVGLDTYHHTFFEMLGNWSFGDYFKAEAIGWAWELIVERWGIPPARLYATVYQPGPGDPAAFDQEAHDLWAERFRSVGLDPAVHVVNGNKADNFWMMGDTGPCGPCSELHVDLTPAGDTGGKLVNAGRPECIEIWNLVFIQFNANEDGTFSPLPARHVDTGMGFERVASILQCTENFTRFDRVISNYETDIFRPIFDVIETMCGQRYGSTLPAAGSTGENEQEKIDVAFRVIADHIRTLAFAIADGIQPGNSDRHYVLRRILRRAVRYGRTLGLTEPFFYRLTDVLERTMGDVFPEIRRQHAVVTETIRREELAFNRTLDKGLALFEHETAGLKPGDRLDGAFVFRLYDEQGFPLDLTELMARERGLSVDTAGFERLMEAQRERARKAQKREVISVANIDAAPTSFLGFEMTSTAARVLDVVELKGKTAVILDHTPFYAEMGGQVGDSGVISDGAEAYAVVDTRKVGAVWLHVLEGGEAPEVGSEVTAGVDVERRRAIERHHSVTHLLHWALHQVVGNEAVQKGSYVGAEKLTFDFSSGALSAGQVREVERLVNERIVENAPISWTEVPYAEVRRNAAIQQFFGDKYGDVVRVVQIGGERGGFNGYSMELCGGTHTLATGEIGWFRVIAESAVAAGIRRIEAVAGLEAIRQGRELADRLATLAGRLNTPLGELERKIDALLAEQKELHKELKAVRQRQAAESVGGLLEKMEVIGETPAVLADLGELDAESFQAVAEGVKARLEGIAILAARTGEGQVALAVVASPEVAKRFPAGKLIGQIAPVVGGKGGGRPDFARGAGKDAGRIGEALEKGRAVLAGN